MTLPLLLLVSIGVSLYALGVAVGLHVALLKMRSVRKVKQ
jgi:hypothetical protein